MKYIIFILFLFVGGCVWQFSLMKDCDKAHTKQYDLQYQEYCEFNQKKF